MYLLKESFASIVTQNGIKPAQGKSAIESWGAACDQHAPECAQAVSAVKPSIAATVKLDMEGRASFSALPSGTWHLFGWTSYNGHHLVWDLQIDLKAGANTFVIDLRNALQLN